MACLCSEKRSRSVHFVSPMYCLLHFLHSIIYVKLVELQVIWCLICLVSPVLVKVYDVLPFSMNGQVRHPCFELQRNVPAGSLGVLLVLALHPIYICILCNLKKIFSYNYYYYFFILLLLYIYILLVYF